MVVKMMVVVLFLMCICLRVGTLAHLIPPSWTSLSSNCTIDVEHGVKTYRRTMNEPEITVFLSCIEPYILVGEKKLVCENGKLNSALPVCASRGCPGLVQPTHGNLKISRDHASARAVCDKDFILVGSPLLYCTDEGVWNDTSPQCMANERERFKWCHFEDAGSSHCHWLSTPSKSYKWMKYASEDAVEYEDSYFPPTDHTRKSSVGTSLVLVTLFPRNGRKSNRRESRRSTSKEAKFVSPLLPATADSNEQLCLVFYTYSNRIDSSVSLHVRINKDVVWVDPYTEEINEEAPLGKWVRHVIDLRDQYEPFHITLGAISIPGMPLQEVPGIAIDDVGLYTGKTCNFTEIDGSIDKVPETTIKVLNVTSSDDKAGTIVVDFSGRTTPTNFSSGTNETTSSTSDIKNSSVTTTNRTLRTLFIISSNVTDLRSSEINTVTETPTNIKNHSIVFDTATRGYIRTITNGDDEKFNVHVEVFTTEKSSVQLFSDVFHHTELTTSANKLNEMRNGNNSTNDNFAFGDYHELVNKNIFSYDEYDSEESTPWITETVTRRTAHPSTVSVQIEKKIDHIVPTNVVALKCTIAILFILLVIGVAIRCRWYLYNKGSRDLHEDRVQILSNQDEDAVIFEMVEVSSARYVQ